MFWMFFGALFLLPALLQVGVRAAGPLVNLDCATLEGASTGGVETFLGFLTPNLQSAISVSAALDPHFLYSGPHL